MQGVFLLKRFISILFFNRVTVSELKDLNRANICTKFICRSHVWYTNLCYFMISAVEFYARFICRSSGNWQVTKYATKMILMDFISDGRRREENLNVIAANKVRTWNDKQVRTKSPFQYQQCQYRSRHRRRHKKHPYRHAIFPFVVKLY